MRKNRTLTLRLSDEHYRKIKACAMEGGVSVSSLIINTVINYVDKDIDIAQQMMASSIRVHSEVRQVKADITLVYNLLYSFIYTFFVAFGKESMNEFAVPELTQDKDILAKGKACRLVADRMMKFFNDKFMSNDSVRNGIMQNLAELLNPETGESGREKESKKR